MAEDKKGLGSLSSPYLREAQTLAREGYTDPFLPYHVTPTGNVEPAVPGLWRNVIDPVVHGVQALGRLQDYGTPDFISDPAGTAALARDSFDATGLAPMASLPATVAGKGVPQGAVGIFGGRLAKTADHAALARAEELAASGAPREQIWKDTGWFQGADGKWRFEIDDFNATLPKSTGELVEGQSARLGDVYAHNDLYAAYPETADARFGISQAYKPGNGAFTKLGDGPLVVSGFDPKRITASDLGAVDILPHELQHMVQRKEGFSPGSSPDRFPVDKLKQEAFDDYSRQISDLMAQDPDAAQAYRALNQHKARFNGNFDEAGLTELDRLEADFLRYPLGKQIDALDWTRGSVATYPDEHWKQLAHQRYEAMPGEVEARNVQKRASMMPDERLASPPWETSDVAWANSPTGSSVPLAIQAAERNANPVANNPQLREYARLVEGENVDLSADNFNWRQEPTMRLEDIDAPGADWMRDEIDMFRSDGMGERADHYQRMISEPMSEEIIVSRGADGRYQIWDGNHKAAAARAAGRTEIPAIVGEPIEGYASGGFVDSVKGWEGFNPKPYWDYRQWTSGYGTRASGPDEEIDRAEADRRLNAELAKARSIVDQIAPNAPEGWKQALTSLTFNAGDKWSRSGLGDAIRRGDWDDARNRFGQYNKAGGEVLPGLARRRQEELAFVAAPSETTLAHSAPSGDFFAGQTLGLTGSEIPGLEQSTPPGMMALGGPKEPDPFNAQSYRVSPERQKRSLDYGVNTGAEWIEGPLGLMPKYSDGQTPLQGFAGGGMVGLETPLQEGNGVSGAGFSGPLHSDVAGRTDHLPLEVTAGSFVIPADIVSSLGEGNTIAGLKILDEMFPKQASTLQFSSGGRVPIMAAGGEHVLSPEQVAAVGAGDLARGQDALDAWILAQRAHTIQTLQSLPGPAKT